MQGGVFHLGSDLHRAAQYNLSMLTLCQMQLNGKGKKFHKMCSTNHRVLDTNTRNWRNALGHSRTAALLQACYALPASAWLLLRARKSRRYLHITGGHLLHHQQVAG